MCGLEGLCAYSQVKHKKAVWGTGASSTAAEKKSVSQESRSVSSLSAVTHQQSLPGFLAVTSIAIMRTWASQVSTCFLVASLAGPGWASREGRAELLLWQQKMRAEPRLGKQLQGAQGLQWRSHSS